jgi:hypothetical protein
MNAYVRVGNSNIVSLSSTLIVRLIAGPLVDRKCIFVADIGYF